MERDKFNYISVGGGAGGGEFVDAVKGSKIHFIRKTSSESCLTVASLNLNTSVTHPANQPQIMFVHGEIFRVGGK